MLANPDKYRFVETVDDILSAKKEGKLAIGFGFQGTAILDNDVNMVGVYHTLGVRTMLMAYNIKNSVGDGSMGNYRRRIEPVRRRGCPRR